jgi:heme-degrading monooxygenase HmoA
MFSRVSIIQGKPEETEAAIRYYREQVSPAVKKMAGFKGAYFLVDRKAGKFLGITLWDTEKNMRDSSAASAQLRAQAARTITFSLPPIVETYEVALQL